jgi:hypothetical protein
MNYRDQAGRQNASAQPRNIYSMVDWVNEEFYAVKPGT